MNNEDFINFIHSFDDDFLMPASEISRSHSGRRDVLVREKVLMYSLDDICKGSEKLIRNLPKTTDAIQYILNGDRLTLFIIEFKYFNIDGDNSNYLNLEAIYSTLKNKNNPQDMYSEKCISDKLLNTFEDVKDDFVDSVEVSLRLKPYETLMVALPLLYEEYSSVNGSSKDFRTFLEDVEVQLCVVVHRVSNIRNISSDRLRIHSIKNALNAQYLRLRLANIISGYDIVISDNFNEFLRKNNLS